MGHGSWVIGMAWQKTLTCHCYSLHMLHTPPHHHGTTNRSDSIDRLDRPSISCFAFWLFEMVRRTKDSQNGMCPFLHKMPSHLHRPARIAFLSIRTTRYFCHKPFASKTRYATIKRQQSLSTALSRYHAHSPSFSPCPRFSNPHRNSHTESSTNKSTYILPCHMYAHARLSRPQGIPTEWLNPMI